MRSSYKTRAVLLIAVSFEGVMLQDHHRKSCNLRRKFRQDWVSNDWYPVLQVIPTTNCSLQDAVDCRCDCAFAVAALGTFCLKTYPRLSRFGLSVIGWKFFVSRLSPRHLIFHFLPVRGAFEIRNEVSKSRWVHRMEMSRNWHKLLRTLVACGLDQKQLRLDVSNVTGSLNSEKVAGLRLLFSLKLDNVISVCGGFCFGNLSNSIRLSFTRRFINQRRPSAAK